MLNICFKWLSSLTLILMPFYRLLKKTFDFSWIWRGSQWFTLRKKILMRAGFKLLGSFRLWRWLFGRLYGTYLLFKLLFLLVHHGNPIPDPELTVLSSPQHSSPVSLTGHSKSASTQNIWTPRAGTHLNVVINFNLIHLIWAFVKTNHTISL